MKTLAEVLKFLPTATCYTWVRGDHPRKGSISIFRDDMAAGVRTIYDIRFTRYSIRATRRTLRAYDPIKHVWNEYFGGSPEWEYPTRAGEKALRAYVATAAKEITGMPNPPVFTWYAGQPARF